MISTKKKPCGNIGANNILQLFIIFIIGSVCFSGGNILVNFNFFFNLVQFYNKGYEKSIIKNSYFHPLANLEKLTLTFKFTFLYS
jgi:hypothetical protein